MLFLAALLSLSASVHAANIARENTNARILILGGGVSGIIAARTLYEQGITNFVIVEGRDELGGRMKSTRFGSRDKMEVTLELGANWVQGTQVGDGPANPMYELIMKHGVRTQLSNFDDVTTYDSAGAVNYQDVLRRSEDDYTELTITGGARVNQSLADSTSRTGYSLSGAKPRTAHERASEYYQFDWEYAQTPEQTSWVASSWANNYTFDPAAGGFSEDDIMSLDQRGFKTAVRAEADEFLKSSQLMLNSVVERVVYNDSGVAVQLRGGKVLRGDFALCTFSVGVLQNDDVVFEPKLPAWKEEAIQSMTMGTYTKIFLQFEEKFWFDTEMALYADPERGRYPVWQSLDHEDYLPDSGIIFVTVTGDYSLRVESLPDAQVRSEVLAVLQNMYPSVEIPEPLDFLFPRWNDDPLYRGSFSNWPPSFVTQHHENLRANVGRLFFAGEAGSLKHFGYLHGAYLDGQTMASVLARCVKEGACTELARFEAVANAIPYSVLTRE